MKESAQPITVTPEIHDAVVNWYRARLAIMNISGLARHCDHDVSTFRKVLFEFKTPKGTPYRFSDQIIQKLHDLILFLNEPCPLPKVPKIKPLRRPALPSNPARVHATA